jgi:hypothetical protein
MVQGCCWGCLRVGTGVVRRLGVGFAAAMAGAAGVLRGCWSLPTVQQSDDVGSQFLGEMSVGRSCVCVHILARMHRVPASTGRRGLFVTLHMQSWQNSHVSF